MSTRHQSISIPSLVLWAYNLVNCIMIEPYKIRWHVIEERMTPWVGQEEMRPMEEKILLIAAKNTPATIDAASNENTHRITEASHCAIIDYGRIWVECQEQELHVRRKVAPVEDDPWVEMVVGAELHPIPVPCSRKKAAEPGSANPAATLAVASAATLPPPALSTPVAMEWVEPTLEQQ